MESTKLFHRDFTLVIIGQIISLFGNAILRYALPLYLLNETHSAALYGAVLALSVLPMLALAPMGGIVADRVNKRNVMVCLDGFTALLILGYTLSYQKLGLVPLLVAVLMILYGIQGAYQPAVQASVPVLVPPQKLMAGNAAINMVNSLSGVLGPVLGGVVFSAWGLRPVLIVSVFCFAASAGMEVFIRIPYQKRSAGPGVLATARADLRESFAFIFRTQPVVAKLGVLAALINMVFSSLIMVGVPVIVNQQLGLPQSVGNRLYGYAEGALALGSLAGGLLAGVLGARLRAKRAGALVFASSLTLLPIGAVLAVSAGAAAVYGVLVACCTAMMVLATLFSVEIITCVQRLTPPALVGKVMALLTCLVMVGNPVGQAAYGLLFERMAGQTALLFFGVFGFCLLLCLAARSTFRELSVTLAGEGV